MVGSLAGIKLLRKQIDAPIRKRLKKVVERPGDSGGFLLGIHAGGIGDHGQCRAKNQRGLVMGQIANVILKELQAIGPREKDIDRKADAQQLRDFAKACPYPLAAGGQGFGSARLHKAFAVHANQCGAGGRRALSKYRVKLAGRQLLHKFGPPWTVLQHRATGFRKDKLPGVPEVRRTRGDRNFVLNGLTRQQFRFEPGMQDDTGFGGTGLTQDQVERQAADPGTPAQLRCLEPHLRFPNQDVNFITACRSGGGHFRTFLVPDHEPPNHDDEGYDANEGQGNPEYPKATPLQMQPGSYKPSQDQPHDKSNRSDPIFQFGVHGDSLMGRKRSNRV